MTSSSKIALLFLLPLAACDRPTAPEARAIARSFEQKFEEGDLRGVTQMFMSLGPPGWFWGSNHAHRNQALEIVRNGVRQRINGFVVEDIIVAPAGIGRPSTRRTLVGWPNDFGFAVYATSDRADGKVVTDGMMPAQGRGDIMVIFRDTAEWKPGLMPDLSRNWLGRTGVIDVGAGVMRQGCGTAKEPPPYNFPDPTVTCDFASYPVSLRADFVRMGDTASFLRKPQHLRIAPQTIPGVRFVTQCAEADPPAQPPSMTGFACANAMQFWRENDQYAPQLGIDLAGFHRSVQGQGWYVRRTSRAPGDRSIGPRWSVFTPDGRLIERDSVSGPTTAQAVSDRLSMLVMQAGVTPEDGRVVVIAPARHLVADASRYAVVVLEMEFSTAP